MSRRDTSVDAEPTIERIAHAFSPAEWSGRWLAVAIIVFAVVATTTVVQRALLAEGTMGWIITAIHGTIVAVVVPAPHDPNSAGVASPSGVKRTAVEGHRIARGGNRRPGPFRQRGNRFPRLPAMSRDPSPPPSR